MKREELSSLSARMSSQRIPVSVTFEIAGKCNLSCLHCMRALEGSELSTKRVESILRELREAGVLELTFTGGEPFSRPDMHEVLTMASELGFALTVFTNGSLLAADGVEKLSGLRIRDVQITIFSHEPKIHDSITGMPGSHEKAVDSLMRLRSAGIRSRAAVMVMASNVDSLGETLGLLDEMGIACNYDFTLFDSDDNEIPMEFLRLGADQVCPLDEVVRSRLGRPGRISGCNMGLATACISSSGDVFPCILFRRSAGNLNEFSFCDIWGSDKMEEYREIGASASMRCSSCPSRNLCFICPGIRPSDSCDGFSPGDEICRITLGRSGLY